ncbi:thiol-disulfide oxidoreductase DCC family protein [Geodermatophilus sp. SYSU D00703]
MESRRSDGLTHPVPAPALVYDGDCGFCTRAAEVARRLLPRDAAVTPWQTTDLAAIGVTPARARREVLWVSRSGRVSGGARAVAEALRAAGGPWALIGVALRVPPLSWLARGVYRLVAANRMRLPGGTAACAVPQPEADRPRRDGSNPAP